MAQVTVTIAGQSYRITCAEGDEAHVKELAAAYDARIDEMRGAFGDIGDLRLYVMAAMIQADELHETKKRLAAVEAELAQARSGGSSGGSRVTEAQLVEGINMAAERIEQLARSLNAPSPVDG